MLYVTPLFTWPQDLLKLKLNPVVISKIERFWDSNVFNEMVGSLWIYFFHFEPDPYDLL